ncbi:MAG TPA: hypothetical protein VFV94_17100, partial [Polyangiaceae bacterium]|nr:hypothetical protein [Polyangiaceae bacterium]
GASSGEAGATTGGTGGTGGGGGAGNETGNGGDSGLVWGDPNPEPAGGIWNCGAPGAGGGGGATNADACTCTYEGTADSGKDRTCDGTFPCCIVSRGAALNSFLTCTCDDKTEAECKAEYDDLVASGSQGYVHVVDSCPTWP